MKLSKAQIHAQQRAQVRGVIERVRAAFPNLPPRQRRPGEDPDVAEVEELGELYKYMFSLCSPARKLELLEMAETSVSGMRQQLENELRSGSKTAAKLLLGLFGDRREGEH
jgi:hypothetical protein